MLKNPQIPACIRLKTLSLTLLTLCLAVITGTKTAKAATLQVVASGLDNPRGITFGPDGALYVAEAGLGGPGPTIAGPVPGVTLSYGPTGAITRVNNGIQERVLTGLPSVLLGEGGASFGNGPTDIQFDENGNAYITVGYSSFPNLRVDLGPAAVELGQLIKFQLNADGSLTKRNDFSADLATFEDLNNPDGTDVVSNPYDLTIQGNNLLVIDAAGNDLLRVDKNTGNISLQAVFPEANFGIIPNQSVPTQLAIDPDGAYYVSELSGYPYPEGGARIFRVVPGNEPEVYADGFTHINGLTFDSEGNLYVLEYSVESLSSTTNNLLGALTKLSPNGVRTPLINPGEGLVAPTGLTFGPDGALYVSNYSALGSQGQVVRIKDLQSVPEPSFALGVLAFGALSVVSLQKSKQKQNLQKN